MNARLLHCLCAAALGLLLFDAGPARAQRPPQPTPPTEPRQRTAEELMEELLTAQQTDDDDLSWLFSDKVYEPSDLGGDSIRAPQLPELGEGTPLVWNPQWRRFRFGNYVFTGAAFAVGIGSAALPPSENRWRGRNNVDESVRSAIGIVGYRSGAWARDTSDAMLSFSVSYPLLFDALIVAYWYRNSPDVAEQMALITVEALTVTTALQGMTAGLTSRERPYVRNCGSGIDPDLDDCDGRKPYRSFFSGHTSMSFAAAGVACSHHLRHELFGDELWDAVACASVMTAAATAGTMRVVGDQHYMSDVATGAAVGTLAGLGVPWLLHYGPLARQDQGRQSVSIRLVPTPQGIGVGGTF